MCCVKFCFIIIFFVDLGFINWRSRMENWNQDLPERYSKFCGLYIKFQGHGKWPWTWLGPRKRQDNWPRSPGHRKWRKACINISKHIEVLKLGISKNANK